MSVILVRNLFHDFNFFKKTKFKINIISIGSLNGGA